MRDNEAPLLFDASRLVWRRWAGVRPTGIDRICSAWLQHYASQSQAVLLHRHGRHILSGSASQALFQLLAEPEAVGDGHGGRNQFRRALIGWGLRHFGSAQRARPGHGRLWLNIGHTGLDLPGLASWCRSAQLRPVLMVHDLIPITHPQYCRAGEADRHRLRMHALLTIGHAVIGNSQHTIETLADFARSEALAMPAALVAWPGTPNLPVTTDTVGGEQRDFIILGTIEGRKNHMLLLDVWDRLLREHGRAAPRLVIIGRRGWACDDVLARLDAGGFGDRVVETGALDDAAIARRLASARALLFPSFAEGYGLPLVEALDAGVPVIASDLPVFLEIGQGVPDLLPPDDVAGWQAAIMAYATDGSPVRAAQMARLAGFRAPDWAGHFARVDAFLKTLQP